MIILLVILFLAIVLLVTWCCLSMAKRQDAYQEQTQQVPPADFPVLRVALDREGVPKGDIVWAELVVMPGGIIWAHGEIQPAPGLVRSFAVRLGHYDERPVLNE